MSKNTLFDIKKKKPKAVTITLRISCEQRDAFSKLCDKQNVGVSDMMRKLMEWYMDAGNIGEMERQKLKQKLKLRLTASMDEALNIEFDQLT